LDSDHKVTFEMQPFLHVEWVGEPKVEDGKITAQVKVTCGVSPEDFRDKVATMGNYTDDFLRMTDIQFFVSYSSSVGYRARDERWSSRIDYPENSFDELFGQTITRSEEHTSELQSRENLVCRLLLEKKNNKNLNS